MDPTPQALDRHMAAIEKLNKSQCKKRQVMINRDWFFGLLNKHINKFTIIVSSKNDISKDKKI